MENLNSVCFISQINEIKPIENSDNIELAIVNGWNCDGVFVGVIDCVGVLDGVLVGVMVFVGVLVGVLDGVLVGVKVFVGVLVGV